jgi:hypothetical protein
MSGKVYRDWPACPRRTFSNSTEAFPNTVEYACAITKPPRSILGQAVEWFCWAVALAMLGSLWFAPQLWDALK